MSGLQYPGQRTDAWDAIGDLLRRVRALEASLGGGGGSDTGTILEIFSTPGPLATFTGEAPQYALADGEIDLVHIAVNPAPTGDDVVVELLNNGAVIGTGTIVDGTKFDTFVPSPAAYSEGDVFTINVTNIGTTQPGKNLQVKFRLV